MDANNLLIHSLQQGIDFVYNDVCKRYPAESTDSATEKDRLEWLIGWIADLRERLMLSISSITPEDIVTNPIVENVTQMQIWSFRIQDGLQDIYDKICFNASNAERSAEEEKTKNCLERMTFPDCDSSKCEYITFYFPQLNSYIQNIVNLKRPKKHCFFPIDVLSVKRQKRAVLHSVLSQINAVARLETLLSACKKVYMINAPQ